MERSEAGENYMKFCEMVQTGTPTELKPVDNIDFENEEWDVLNKMMSNILFQYRYYHREAVVAALIKENLTTGKQIGQIEQLIKMFGRQEITPIIPSESKELAVDEVSNLIKTMYDDLDSYLRQIVSPETLGVTNGRRRPRSETAASNVSQRSVEGLKALFNIEHGSQNKKPKSTR